MLKHSLALLAVERSSQHVFADALPILVTIADPDGTVSFFNEAWYEFTGQSRSAEPFSAWREFVHPSDAERVVRDWGAAIAAADDVVDMHYRLRHAASGEYRWFHARAIAIRDAAGNIAEWLGTAIDIDEERQKQAELAQQYDSEHAVATTLQQASMPPSLPHVDGIVFEAHYAPSYASMTIGGDWYDAFALPDGSIAIGIGIGDVMGRGVEAAVLMGKLRYSTRAIALRTFALGSGGPASVLESVEETLLSEHPDGCATSIFAIISADRTQLRYSNAGHPPAVLLANNGTTSWFEDADTPLGWRFGDRRQDRSVSLADVSRLVLYTDGLIETGRDIDDGLTRLAAAVARSHSTKRGKFLPELIAGTTVARPQDDLALLAVTFTDGYAYS